MPCGALGRGGLAAVACGASRGRGRDLCPAVDAISLLYRSPCRQVVRALRWPGRDQLRFPLLCAMPSRDLRQWGILFPGLERPAETDCVPGVVRLELGMSTCAMYLRFAIIPLA